MPVMQCPDSGRERSCTWCETDRLVAACSTLPTAIREYCDTMGLTSWFAVCAHLGGDCRGCGAVVLGMCRSRLQRCAHPPPEWEPEDVRQALFMRILKVPWNVERAPLGAWLELLIRRLVIDAIKSAHRQRTKNISAADEGEGEFFDAIPDEGAWANPTALAELRELRERFHAALAALPLEDRQIITLRFIEGHTFQEIADELGMALTTTHRKAERAMNALREKLGPLAGSEAARPGAKP